jgi:hypothetical protein
VFSEERREKRAEARRLAQNQIADVIIFAGEFVSSRTRQTRGKKSMRLAWNQIADSIIVLIDTVINSWTRQTRAKARRQERWHPGWEDH